MASRLNLQTMFENLIGSRNVYYQPPEEKKMKYPAIEYSRNNINNLFADDNVYIQARSYEVIVIDEDPDSEIVDNVSKLPRCRHERHYTSENLNHDVFTLYY